jgi:hypothetical protein
MHIFELLEWRQLLTVINVNPQPVALQVPYINALLQRSVGGTPLADANGTFKIVSLFDTASPGLIISNSTADGLGVQRVQAGGSDAVFAQDYSTGELDFGISEQLDMSLASFNPLVSPDIASNYKIDTGLSYLQIGDFPTGSDPNDPVQAIVGAGAADTSGVGNVVVMDPTPTNTFDTTFRDFNAYIYPAGTPFNTDPDTSTADPGIPPVSNEVQLTYADDTRFTNNVSGATNTPSLHKLIFVGPNPIDPTLPDNTPPVTVALGGSNITGSLLLDTGSASSMISLAKAASLGITYTPGTFGTSSAALVGVPSNAQFRLTLQSLAGPVTLAGFYASSLTLQSDNGPIEFDNVPLLVGDVAIGSASGAHQTLDGVLGMNLFSASGALDAHGKLINQTPGAFNWITLDESKQTLGLDIAALAAQPQVVASSFNYAGTQQSVTIQFTGETSGPVSSDFTLEDAHGNPTDIAVSSAYSAATHTATVTFPNLPNGMLPDGNYLLDLSDAGNVEDDNGAGLANDYTLAFWTFQGDANHDRTVNALDFNALASHFGQSNQGFANGDFNYDGVVNTTDFALLAGQFSHIFTGPDAPSELLAPAGVIAPASGAAAPGAALGALFSDVAVNKDNYEDLLG